MVDASCSSKFEATHKTNFVPIEAARQGVQKLLELLIDHPDSFAPQLTNAVPAGRIEKRTP